MRPSSAPVWRFVEARNSMKPRPSTTGPGRRIHSGPRPTSIWGFFTKSTKAEATSHAAEGASLLRDYLSRAQSPKMRKDAEKRIKDIDEPSPP